VVVPGLLWVIAAPAGADEACRARIAQLEASRQAVEALLGQVDALIGGLEEQLAVIRKRLETSEDPEEQARLEELAIRLAEQVGRAQDQRAVLEGQLGEFREAMDALGNCGQ
jgi:predicted RNase H-like nuclease (RuvC/YqgF family)